MATSLAPGCESHGPSAPNYAIVKPGTKNYHAILYVDDKRVVADIADYTFRLVAVEGQDPEPVLYHKGKRVTCRWYVQIIAIMGADTSGSNANTA